MSDLAVPPSALTYLYGDKLEDLFGGRSRLPFHETLPCREVKVKRKDLADAMVVSAFVFLAEQGHLVLAVQTTGRLVKRRFVQATRSSSPADSLSGLESQLASCVGMDPKRNDVPSVVWRLWRNDIHDPFGDVINMGKAHLRALGCFHEGQRRGVARILGKQLVPDCERILALRGQVRVVHEMLATFRGAQAALYAQLWKDVEKGIASRQEQQDVDTDF
jgi:hypothetical protein